MTALHEVVETRATDLLAIVSQNSKWLAAFSERIESTAQQFRSLGDLSARGYSIILSLDTCELIDTTGRAGHIAPDATDLTRRRVLADIGFSRAAMRMLSESPLSFTILPGTAAEIVLYLTKQYVRNVKFIAALKRTELLEALAVLGDDVSSDTVEQIGTSENGLDIAIDAFRRHLVVTDRFMETIGDLLADPKFVSPRRLRLGEIVFDHDRYLEIFEAIMAVRRRNQPVNCVIDAVNLATAGAVSDVDDSRVVLHMTRSPSLHQLEKRGVILDTSVLLRDDVGSYPIICRPDAVWLFNRVIPTMRDGTIPYSVVETIYLEWMSTASHLRQLHHASPEERRRWLEDPQFEVPADPIFEEYLRLFIDSAIRAEQLIDEGPDVMDADAQHGATVAQAVESDVVLQQGRIRSIFRLLRIVRGGVEHAMMLAGGSTEANQAVNEPFGFLSDAGLQPVVSESDGMREIVIYHPATPEAVLVGCQLYRRDGGGAGCTVYWPTACKRAKFLRAVANLEPTSRFFALLAFEDGDLDYAEMDGVDLAHDNPLKLYTDKGYIQTVQLVGPSRTYTSELLLAGSEAYTSIRVTSISDDAIARFYEATEGELPPSLVADVIAASWRTFFDGDSS